MKRDWRLIRKILTILEDVIQHELDPEDIPIYKHCQLLKDAGYIVLVKNIGWLTMKGHDLLEYLGNGTAIEELEEMDIPITEYTLKKYAEFMLEKELFEEVEIDD